MKTVIFVPARDRGAAGIVIRTLLWVTVFYTIGKQQLQIMKLRSKLEALEEKKGD